MKHSQKFRQVGSIALEDNNFVKKEDYYNFCLYFQRLRMESIEVVIVSGFRTFSEYLPCLIASSPREFIRLFEMLVKGTLAQNMPGYWGKTLQEAVAIQEEKPSEFLQSTIDGLTKYVLTF